MRIRVSIDIELADLEDTGGSVPSDLIASRIAEEAESIATRFDASVEHWKVEWV